MLEGFPVKFYVIIALIPPTALIAFGIYSLISGRSYKPRKTTRPVVFGNDLPLPPYIKTTTIEEGREIQGKSANEMGKVYVLVGIGILIIYLLGWYTVSQIR